MDGVLVACCWSVNRDDASAHVFTLNTSIHVIYAVRTHLEFVTVFRTSLLTNCRVRWSWHHRIFCRSSFILMVLSVAMVSWVSWSDEARCLLCVWNSTTLRLLWYQNTYSVSHCVVWQTVLFGCVWHMTVGGTSAAAPQPFRPGNPVLCGSHPLVTPY